MTPLAMMVTKDLIRPVKERSPYDNCGILKLMSDIHCFEITQIHQEAHILGKEAFLQGLTDRQTFLPAPKTWIEYKTKMNHIGVLAIQVGSFAKCYTVTTLPQGGWVSHSECVYLDLDPSAPSDERMRCNRTEFGDLVREKAGVDFGFLETHAAKVIFGALAFINSPKIIGRRTHTPHRGLERELIKQQKVIGKFPLHAWTEIILDVTPPKEADGQHDYEAHLTGRRALHFCRAHLRIRDGKLQFVKAHWRGDASIGIKRSRYIVKGKAA